MSSSAIAVSPEIMSGAPVFAGTRVPIAYLFGHLENGETIASFLEAYPTVTRAQVVAVLRQAEAKLAGKAA
jgi:uncharacterized protein (DUF433 family)